MICKLVFFFFFLKYCFEFSHCKKIFCDYIIDLCKFTSKLIMFQKALQFWKAIVFCYSRQIGVKVINCIPPSPTWRKLQIIEEILSPIIIDYVKPIKGSLIVEWCIECNHIHELQTKARNELSCCFGCFNWWCFKLWYWVGKSCKEH